MAIPGGHVQHFERIYLFQKLRGICGADARGQRTSRFHLARFQLRQWQLHYFAPHAQCSRACAGHARVALQYIARENGPQTCGLNVALLRACPIHVHEVDVSTRAVRKHGDHVCAFVIPKKFGKREGVIGGEFQPADRIRMHGEINVRSNRNAARRVEIYERHVRINRPSHAHDVRVQFPGVPAHGPVFHEKAPIVAEMILALVRHGHTCRLKCRFSESHRFGNSGGKRLGVFANHSR